MGRPTTQRSTFYQIIHALNDQPLGRRTLVEKTGITEMTVRTHLNKLRDAGLVSMTKSGTALTEKASEQLSDLLEAVADVQVVNCEELSLNSNNIAAQIRGSADRVKHSLLYRDAAVRAGASGAILLVWHEDGWAFREDHRAVSTDFPVIGEMLRERFPGAAGDVLVIAFGESSRMALTGLWSVIAEMIPTGLENELHKESG